MDGKPGEVTLGGDEPRAQSALGLRLANKIARIGVERLCQAAQHGHAGRDIGALNLADVARADAGSIGQLLLRHCPVMAQPTQVRGHDLLEVHGANGLGLESSFQERSFRIDRAHVSLHKFLA